MSAPTPAPTPPYAGPATPATVTPAPSGLLGEHPELLAAGAFAGGLLFATLLKRLG